MLTLLRIDLKTVSTLRLTGEVAAAGKVLMAGWTRLKSLDESAFEESGAAKVRTAFWRAKAEYLAAANQPGAEEAVQKCVAMGEEQVVKEAGVIEALTDHLRSCVTAGQILARQGDTTGARRHWQRAIDLGASRANSSQYWALLDPIARALALMGRTEDGRAIVDRLVRIGYAPLERWPAGLSK
jgi:hypothetical protein